MAPKLTVFVSTYNQERFVADALESVLQQRVDFPVEILCADDCSTDGTLATLKTYAARHPKLVRVVSMETNLGSTESPGGCLAQNPIMARLIPGIAGEYVAWLDGDDYWVSADKLQRQVDHLDSHPHCTVAFHAVDNLYPDGCRQPFYEYEARRAFYTLADVVIENFICASSVVHRTGLLASLPAVCNQIPGDWCFLITLASQGSIAFQEGVWAVRRVHPDGMISMKPDTEKLALNIEWLSAIQDHVGEQFGPRIRERIADLQDRRDRAVAG